MPVEDKIKVMHIIETLEVGGAESVLVDIVNTMNGNIKSSICCFKTGSSLMNS